MAILSGAACQEIRTVSVTVVEEDGTPVVWRQSHHLSSWVTRERTTGRSVAERPIQRDTITRPVDPRPHETASMSVEKEGYYKSYIGRLSRKEDHNLRVVLRRKKNPRPLYAKKAKLRFPVNRTWIGYDFEIGDWVAPHGKGKVADAEFRCDTEKTGFMDGKGILEIRFNEGEGFVRIKDEYLQNNTMKIPHEAPTVGFSPSLAREEQSYHNKNAESGIGYFFRTRLRTDSDGQVISAHYGKILEDIRFSPQHGVLDGKNYVGGTWFTYYFNPDPNDRNLEFDPSQNLFEDLEPEEMVREP